MRYREFPKVVVLRSKALIGISSLKLGGKSVSAGHRNHSIYTGFKEKVTWQERVPERIKFAAVKEGEGALQRQTRQDL